MEIIKTVVLECLFPFPVSLEMLLLGIGILWFSKWQRLGKSLVSVAAFGLLLISTYPFPAALLSPLESSYAPLLTGEDFERKTIGIEYIVILAAGGVYNPSLPPTSQHYDSQLIRAVEGLRLYRKLPTARLIVSGGGLGPISEAEMIADLLVALGVDRGDILLESASGNTAEQVGHIQGIVKGEKFLLVTSAAHLPRAMALFEHQRLYPLPAPTQHLLQQSEMPLSRMFSPTAENLRRSRTALYGILARLKDRLAGNL